MSYSPTQWMGITVTRSDNHDVDDSYALIHLDWTTGPLVDHLRTVRMASHNELVIWKEYCQRRKCLNPQCRLEELSRLGVKGADEVLAEAKEGAANV